MLMSFTLYYAAFRMPSGSSTNLWFLNSNLVNCSQSLVSMSQYFPPHLQTPEHFSSFLIHCGTIHILYFTQANSFSCWDRPLLMPSPLSKQPCPVRPVNISLISCWCDMKIWHWQQWHKTHHMPLQWVHLWQTGKECHSFKEQLCWIIPENLNFMIIL